MGAQVRPSTRRHQTQVGKQVQKPGDAVKRLDRLDPNLAHTYADPSGNGYTPNKVHLETQGGSWGGVLGVKHSKVLGSCQTAGLIDTNFGSRLRIHMGMDTG